MEPPNQVNQRQSLAEYFRAGSYPKLGMMALVYIGMKMRRSTSLAVLAKVMAS